jgi:hypothetical protein
MVRSVVVSAMFALLLPVVPACAQLVAAGLNTVELPGVSSSLDNSRVEGGAVGGGGAAADVPPAFARPFNSLGVDAKVGAGGFGFDVATNLLPKLNLRGGGSFFGYSAAETVNNVNYSGTLTLRSGQLNVDFFPFGGGFRLTGGVEFYNANQIVGSGVVAGQQSFSINNTTYYSSSTDPVTANATLMLGNKVAPLIGFGSGNLIPRRAGARFSLVTEAGFAFVGSPKVALAYTGTACTGVNTGCQSIASASAIQQNIAAQQATFVSDISILKVYPLFSIGLGIKLK